MPLPDILKTITTQTDTKIATAKKPRHSDHYMATLHAQGTFDSTTLTLKTSVDGGSTLVTVTESGSAKTLTSSGSLNIVLGFSFQPDALIDIYLTSSGGGGSTDIDVYLT